MITNLSQLLWAYYRLIADYVRTDLFKIVFPMLMAFASLIGCVCIIRYLVSLRR